MNLKNKHIVYIAGLVLSLISMIPPLPGILKYLIAIIPVLYFGADLTLSYMDLFFKGGYINKYLAGILSGLALIFTGKIEYAALTMLFLSAGDYYFEMLLDKARRNIEEASRITAPFARIPGSRVSPKSVLPGQLLIIQQGDIIPCDCVVTNGSAGVDYTNLFGEGELRSVKAGSTCFAGGIVQQGGLTVKAIKTPGESTAAVVNSYTKKAAKPSRYQKRLNGWVKLFEYGVFVFALLALIIFAIATQGDGIALTQAAAILLICSVPGITRVTPLLNRNALLCGRRSGALFTDIAALEQCGDIKTVTLNEPVTDEVYAAIEETGAIPASGGNTVYDAVVYRDKARLEADKNPSFKLSLGFFSPKAQAASLEPKPENIAGAVRTARNYTKALKLNLVCVLTQKLASLALIFGLNINPATVLVIEFAACMFCLYNSTKEL